MNEIIQALVFGSALFVVHLCLVLGLLHKIIPNKLSPMTIHVLSGFCTLVIFLGLWLTQPTFDVWLTFTIFAFASSAFLFLFSAIYKSLSLGFLLAIRKNAQQATIPELDALVTYASFEERINILCQMGLAAKEGEKYRITQKGLRLASRIQLFRKLFGITTLGLYQEN